MANCSPLSFPTGVKMKELADLAAQIPGTFWGVIIGSLFTLTATLGSMILLNRGNDRRLRSQLDQDRELKNRDREMSLRRDIYLAAAEAAAAGLIAIGRFTSIKDFDEKLIDGYTEKSPAIIKVHIVAKEETVKAVINFSTELNATFLRLYARRAPLVFQKQKIDILRAQFDSSMKENSRSLELMNQYNLEGLHDQYKWDALQRNFEQWQRSGEEDRLKADILDAELRAKHFEYMEECCGEAIKLGRILTPALISIRKELDLPIDEVEFCRISEEAIIKQIESLKEFMQNFQAVIAAQADPPADAPSS